ncbi:Hsp20/alpha crystallin family protein [Pirellulaceae bacterium SH501]
MSNFLNGGLARSFSPETLAVVGRDFDGLFDQFFGSQRGRDGDVARADGSVRALRVPTHVWEKEDRLHVSVDMPGVNKEAISLTFENGTLVVEAERKAPELGEHKTWHNSLHYGLYKQKIAVGDSYAPETIEATFSDGVLHIQIAKRPEVQPRKVEIK